MSTIWRYSFKLEIAVHCYAPFSASGAAVSAPFRKVIRSFTKGPACLAVKPLDLHLVNVGSIPTGPTHGEGRLQPHTGDVLKSTPNVRTSPRSGLNLEGRLSDPQVF